MGLDMYFEKRTYVKNWNHMKETEKTHVTITGKASKHIKPDRITNITEEIGYLRKANAIHNWIVENVADGVDDCNDVYLSRDDIKKLLDTINEVLENSKLVQKGKRTETLLDKDGLAQKEVPNMVIEDTSVAERLLPPTNGCFFGSTEYDDWYIKDLKEAKKICESLLDDGKELMSDFYYRASW